MKKQNGGSIRFNAVRLENVTIHDEPYLELTYLMGVGEDLGILDSPWLLEEWEMPNDLILLNGDGHSWIALDYRQNKEEPSIVYLDNESELDVTIASTFDDFLQQLYIEEDLPFYEDPAEEERWENGEITEEELAKALSSSNEFTVRKALTYLNQHPNSKLLESHVFDLFKHKKWEIKEAVGFHFYYENKVKSIDEEHIKKAMEIMKKDPDVSYYNDWIEEWNDEQKGR